MDKLQEIREALVRKEALIKVLQVDNEMLEVTVEQLQKQTTCQNCGGTGIVEMSFDPYYSEPCECTIDWMSEAFKQAEKNRSLTAQNTAMKEALEKAQYHLAREQYMSAEDVVDSTLSTIEGGKA